MELPSPETKEVDKPEEPRQEGDPSEVKRIKSFFDKPMWVYILAVYMTLFLFTGYLAFVHKNNVTNLDARIENMVSAKDDEVKDFIIQYVKNKEEENLDKQKVAEQSFHIIMGALLGFLSALATSATRRGNA